MRETAAAMHPGFCSSSTIEPCSCCPVSHQRGKKGQLEKSLACPRPAVTPAELADSEDARFRLVLRSAASDWPDSSQHRIPFDPLIPECRPMGRHQNSSGCQLLHMGSVWQKPPAGITSWVENGFGPNALDCPHMLTSHSNQFYLFELIWNGICIATQLPSFVFASHCIEISFWTCLSFVMYCIDPRKSWHWPTCCTVPSSLGLDVSGWWLCHLLQHIQSIRTTRY